ncbi:MAG TPA: universal stress protein [Pyrinomonadaceae bacterium]|nr:universal stress protein [Pyrinomonadaceae bacterium]
MRILIAYDGSAGADEALDDLPRAGLGNSVEALILSVAELWLPPPPPSTGLDESFPLYTPPGLQSAREHVAQAVEQVRSLATNASARVQATFPSWKVSTEVSTGSPAWEVINKADAWDPDLVIVGSQGRSALGRLFLGSVSQKILTEARCSVRVGRRPTTSGAGSLRVVVGVDGSPGAEAAVQAVAKREWPSNTEISVIAVQDPNVSLALGSLNPQVTEWMGEADEGDRQWVRKMVEAASEDLRRAGLNVSSVVKEGDAKKVLVDEAQGQGADCIFVGSTGFSNRLERFLLGSVSAAVANRAECSVEVVRKNAIEEV